MNDMAAIVSSICAAIVTATGAVFGYWKLTKNNYAKTLRDRLDSLERENRVLLEKADRLTHDLEDADRENTRLKKMNFSLLEENRDRKQK
jgi:predicted nuclease with TOPRIM domain